MRGKKAKALRRRVGPVNPVRKYEVAFEGTNSFRVGTQENGEPELLHYPVKTLRLVDYCRRGIYQVLKRATKRQSNASG